MVRCIEKLREYEDNASVSALFLVGKTEFVSGLARRKN